MKQAFKWEMYMVGDMYKGRKIRLSISTSLHTGGKASLSLCGGVV